MADVVELPAMPDLEKEYDEKIAPLVQHLVETCSRLGLPVIVLVQFAAPGVASSVFMPEWADERLTMAAILARARSAGMVVIPLPNPEEDVKH
ncbi:MAG TPA: hypothetical protein VGK74_22330 [Symbiobacteriaceae bacterium]|jgi:hypothetical protein